MNAVRRYEYVAGAAISLAFLTPLMVWGPFDTEETALGIFSSQVHYAHLLRGEWLYWFDDLGFGTPLPIGHRLDAHPAMALTAMLSLRAALSWLWALHAIVSTVYTLRLLALGGVRPPLRLVVTAFHSCSVVTACWFYMNDWATFVVGWTMLPVLLFYLRLAVTEPAGRSRRVALVTLALAFAFLVLNSHPGYVAPLAVALTIYALASAPRTAAMYGGFVAALLVCVAITGERLFYFATEAALFPAEAPRMSQDAYAIGDHLRALAVPLLDIDGQGRLRLPFVGAPLVLLAFLTVRRWRTADRHERACFVTFVACFGLSLVPPDRFAMYTAASGSWLFRDPMAFMALLLGGARLQRLADRPVRTAWVAVAALLAVQLTQQGAVLRSGWREYSGRRPSAQFVRAAAGTNLPEVIARHAARYGRRIYLSPRAQADARGALSPAGVRVVTDLALAGLHPITAWFKGVSMDALYPSLALMHGFIRGEADVIANAPLLDVLGIGLVLREEGEGPVPPGLAPLERLPVETTQGPVVLQLLGNPDAWPDGVVLAEDAASVHLPQRPACPNDRVLCRDFTPLAGRRLDRAVIVDTSNGTVTGSVAPSDRPQVVFLSMLYRPEWRAQSPAGPLRVDRLAGAFVGVTVPAGVSRFELVFRPTWRIGLQWVSLLTALGAMGYLGWQRWRR
jgi:hypothetical protein